MSWVLILVPRRIVGSPAFPAVVGGYRSREEAEAAAREAIVEDEYGFIHGEYDRFVVIPGAADTAP